MRLIQQLLCFWGFLAAFVEAGRSDAPVNQLFRTHSIYISLNYLRVTNRENKYHWQLFVTDGEKKGKGYHITNVDATGKQVPFFYDSYDGNDPTRSSSMILLYSVLDAPAVNTFEVIDAILKKIDPAKTSPSTYLPGTAEKSWTCRVWVLAALAELTKEKPETFKLPWSITETELRVKKAADHEMYEREWGTYAGVPPYRYGGTLHTIQESTGSSVSTGSTGKDGKKGARSMFRFRRGGPVDAKKAPAAGAGKDSEPADESKQCAG